MSRTLPEGANLEFLSKQAKQLLRDVKRGDASPRERLRTWGRPGAPVSSKLADCHHALAREYNFASWAKLRAHVEMVGVDTRSGHPRDRRVPLTDVAQVAVRKWDPPATGGLAVGTTALGAVVAIGVMWDAPAD